ncbi:MAG: DUF3379 family protein [Lysobacteraceae bacterium]
MDCLEFRRRLGAEPSTRDPAMLAHREECTACAAAHVRAQHFEHELANALNVQVPANLAERVLLAQATGQRRQFVQRRRTVFALAASIVCAIGVGGVAWQQVDAHSLPALSVAHMPGEIGTFQLTTPISAQSVLAGFAKRHIELKGALPNDTTYVQDCPVGSYKTVHLVSRVNGQPVAVLYFPNTHAARKDFKRNGWHGREVPLANGTLVMLTDRDGPHPFDAIEQSWRVAIDGPTEQRLSML